MHSASNNQPKKCQQNTIFAQIETALYNIPQTPKERVVDLTDGHTIGHYNARKQATN